MNKSNKFTPGPWSIHNGGESEYLIKGDNWVIATTDKPHASQNSTEKANARLIAAAPDLLDASGEALKHLEHSGDCKHDPDPTYDSDGHIRMGRMPCPVCLLERAIAKATGGAE